MEFLRRYWTQVRAQTAQMPANTKLLIGSLVIILLMAGFLVIQYAAAPQMAPITPFVGDRQAEAIALLKQHGIDVKTENAQVLVPYDKQVEAIALLESGRLMVPDTSKAFDDVILKSSPWDPSAKTSMAFLQAKQKFLAAVIGKMKGVRAADVVISVPQQTGFGRAHVKPSASVNVVMAGGKVNKQLVEAIAGLVAGAVSELPPTAVNVIDALEGRIHHVADAEDASNDQAMATVVALESRYQQKITDVLRYIPGVIVAVNVRTDPNLKQNIESFKYGEQPVKNEKSEISESNEVRAAGETGVRANAGAEIGATSKNGSTTKSEKTETTFDAPTLTERAVIRKAGQSPQEIHVTVNVPRSYFIALFKRGKADAADPDDAALQPVVDTQLAEIKKQVEPLIKSETAGSVAAHMILDAGAMLAMGEMGVGGGGVATFVSSGWFKPAMLGGLALVSVGLMFHLVRKATRMPPLPSAEELAGLPPKLDVDSDLVGEVEAHDPAMAGLELSDGEVQNRKVTQQIDELVGKYPAEAAAMFKRWVRAEDV